MWVNESINLEFGAVQKNSQLIYWSVLCLLREEEISLKENCKSQIVHWQDLSPWPRQLSPPPKKNCLERIHNGIVCARVGQICVGRNRATKVIPSPRQICRICTYSGSVPMIRKIACWAFLVRKTLWTFTLCPHEATTCTQRQRQHSHPDYSIVNSVQTEVYDEFWFMFKELQSLSTDEDNRNKNNRQNHWNIFPFQKLIEKRGMF